MRACTDGTTMPGESISSSMRCAPAVTVLTPDDVPQLTNSVTPVTRVTGRRHRLQVIWPNIFSPYRSFVSQRHTDGDACGPPRRGSGRDHRQADNDDQPQHHTAQR